MELTAREKEDLAYKQRVYDLAVERKKQLDKMGEEGYRLPSSYGEGGVCVEGRGRRGTACPSCYGEGREGGRGVGLWRGQLHNPTDIVQYSMWAGGGEDDVYAICCTPTLMVTQPCRPGRTSASAHQHPPSWFAAAPPPPQDKPESREDRLKVALARYTEGEGEQEDLTAAGEQVRHARLGLNE